MIVRKTWERFTKDKRAGWRGTSYRDVYTGWFLMGIIPLYITRERLACN